MSTVRCAASQAPARRVLARMIVLDCEQGTRAWHEARLGIPTASEFKRVVTNGGARCRAARGGCGTGAELLVEWATGEPYKTFESDWTEYGKAMEPAARAAYSFHRDLSVSQVGLCYRDDKRLVAASPDGLVGGDKSGRGALELKCPSPEIHLLYLSMGVVPTKYVIQVQGHLWVTGLEWCDFMSFHPDYPALIVRTFPDPARQAALDEHIPAFVDEVLEGRRWLEEAGVHGWRDAA